MKPTIKSISALLRELKGQISDDYRCSDDPGDNTPGMQVTVSTDNELSRWHYQTGDNSYSGGCYSDPHWAVIYLYRRSNCTDLARTAVGELLDSVADAKACAKFNATPAPAV